MIEARWATSTFKRNARVVPLFQRRYGHFKRVVSDDVDTERRGQYVLR